MRRLFIASKGFDKNWSRMGLTDNERRGLESLLLKNPKTGDVIPGLLGARKVRYGLDTHGKSGGIRAIYLDIEADHIIYLITAYPKGTQEDLTPEQKRLIQDYIRIIKGAHNHGKRKRRF